MRKTLNSRVPDVEFIETDTDFQALRGDKVLATWPKDPAGRNAIMVALHRGVEAGCESYVRQVRAHALAS